MFRGRYQHTIDPKGRVSVPAKYRDVLAQYESPALIVVPNGTALEVHPLQEWERIEAQINEQSSMFDAEVRRAGRLYISHAKEVDLDSAADPAAVGQPRAGRAHQGRDARRHRATIFRDLGPHAVRGVRADERRRRHAVGLRAPGAARGEVVHQ